LKSGYTVAAIAAATRGLSNVRMSRTQKLNKLLARSPIAPRVAGTKDEFQIVLQAVDNPI